MTADKKAIINTADCMRYPTANADPFTILEEPVIKWRLIYSEGLEPQNRRSFF